MAISSKPTSGPRTRFCDRSLYGYDVSICPTKSAGEFWARPKSQ
jgi:hypothetical protein